MRPIEHYIEEYRSEEIFDESEMTFGNATGKLITWLVRGGYACYRTISESK